MAERRRSPVALSELARSTSDTVARERDFGGCQTAGDDRGLADERGREMRAGVGNLDGPLLFCGIRTNLPLAADWLRSATNERGGTGV